MVLFRSKRRRFYLAQPLPPSSTRPFSPIRSPLLLINWRQPSPNQIPAANERLQTTLQEPFHLFPGSLDHRPATNDVGLEKKDQLPSCVAGNLAAHKHHELVAACALPQLMEESWLPSDVVSRARLILDHCPGNSVGSIMFKGVSIIRQHVADYISERDGVQANMNDVFLCSGVFHGATLVMNVLKECMNGKPPGAMTCMPQYVAFHHFFDEFGFQKVFEHNIYTEHAPFHSFRKVMHKMGDPWSKTQLITFNSLSKGIMAEDGLQCGYFEIVNLNGDDKKRLLKAVVELLPSTLSQVALDCLVKPPQPGDPSYDLYIKEKNTILESLKNRAELVQNTLNSIEGFYCSQIQGAMCAFPRVSLPQKAIDKAKSLGQEPSYFYASQLLEKKGVCVTPGSAFGQLPGTCHFRVTILPPMAKLLDMLGRIKDFHEELTDQYK
ncbi:hypothetical protein HPB47_008133 [Ixodes persulcatus]|uniref:Uncharacterized protein n=1 Tax=Ixodes persulcatus TaxID=34615 RepID=A0AC60P5M9_IXOPE|nr:hypothetical protein HPB47_008133 [Ixodes persulcatus]